MAMGKSNMKKLYSLLLGVTLFLFSGSGTHTVAQQAQFQVSVDLVQLNVAVTDNKGNYVNGLKPSDFVINEDGLTQKLAFFGEGNGPTMSLVEVAQNGDKGVANASYSTAAGTPPKDASTKIGRAHV